MKYICEKIFSNDKKHHSNSKIVFVENYPMLVGKMSEWE